MNCVDGEQSEKLQDRFRLSRNLGTLAGEPQKLDKQKYVSRELLFKNIPFRHFRRIGRTLP